MLGWVELWEFSTLIDKCVICNEVVAIHFRSKFYLFNQLFDFRNIEAQEMGHKVGKWENNKRIRTNAATDIVVNQMPEGYLLKVAKSSKPKKIIK